MKKTVLTYKDFIFESDEVCQDRFNLFRASKRTNKKTGKETDSKKLIGYGYRFHEAIEMAIQTGLSEREDITTLNGYVDEYKSAKEDIKTFFK